MKIGYPCICLSLPCRASSTFRLRSYSAARLKETVAANLDCLRRILEFNAARGILHFRITSDLVPFASHPVCRARWRDGFREEFAAIGSFIRKAGFRISMHPDQFTLINSPDPGIVERSFRELEYHADVLDLLGLSSSAKIQIHVGGVYGERDKAIDRFASAYGRLPKKIRRRLTVENDDRLFPLRDCLRVHELTGVPVVFDVLHHRILNRGESAREGLCAAAKTWGKPDGIPIVDYSCQDPARRPGAHCLSIDLKDFRDFLRLSRPLDFDIMLEIKDKEASALRALRLARRDGFKLLSSNLTT